ncbi:agc pdk1 protein kinase [Stylonychia lemnae]|uniref:non-specific serine/threonine protein kinase n=1 Tax=Stylonychia lemnae TaxID=5949 RepID=A0A078AEH0_STYLE|nr:agc pdk1 protein kinase [Stylonychia lemnae]|eukprot:CDW79872.1 agc pdk1 protein kinase [Stylonychia lemnae]
MLEVNQNDESRVLVRSNEKQDSHLTNQQQMIRLVKIQVNIYQLTLTKQRQTTSNADQINTSMLFDQVDFEKLSLDDFVFGKKLGSGSFGQVFKTKFMINNQSYALKKLEKKFIEKDQKHVYFLYEYVNKGTLSRMIRKFEGKFPIDLAKFYIAEIICDFGDSIRLDQGKYFKEDKDVSYLIPQQGTFCGTPLYVSPEMLEKSISSPGADLWALGVIIYELVCGTVPFKSSQEWQTFQLIINVDYKFTPAFDKYSQDLITKLLKKDPQQRIGAGPPGSKNDFQVLKEHPFFDGIDFNDLHLQQPPLKYSQIKQSSKLKHQSAIIKEVETAELMNTNISKQNHKRHQTIDADMFMKEQQINQLTNNVNMMSFNKTPPLPKREMMQQIKELKKGLLKKKNRFYMQQQRIFILTSEPRLKYYKNDADFRGEISLTQDVVAKYNGDGSFKLSTNRKVYVLKEVNAGEAEEWVIAINNAVEQFGQNSNSSVKQ